MMKVLALRPEVGSEELLDLLNAVSPVSSRK